MRSVAAVAAKGFSVTGIRRGSNRRRHDDRRTALRAEPHSLGDELAALGTKHRSLRRFRWSRIVPWQNGRFNGATPTLMTVDGTSRWKGVLHNT
jgi:hypothetical protein